MLSPYSAYLAQHREKPAHMCDFPHRRAQRLVQRLGRRSDPLPCITDTDLFLCRSTRSGRYRTAGLCLSPLYKLVSSPRAWLHAATTDAAVAATFVALRVYVYVRTIFRTFFHLFFLCLLVSFLSCAV